jgi:uncharacterized protein YjbI with pentapeptide repeats
MMPRWRGAKHSAPKARMHGKDRLYSNHQCGTSQSQEPGYEENTMLKDFFKLNSAYTKFSDSDRLIQHLRTSNDLRNILFEPDAWPSELARIKDKTFNNVSLAKTTFVRATFTNCIFEDCLFIGSSFENVEFHRCLFRNCNFYKSSFRSCYIDPKCIQFDRSFKITHPNIMTTLFQQILDNSRDQSQFDFAADADIQFRRWKRAQLSHDFSTDKITRKQYYVQKGGSLLYDCISGYGYQPGRFFVCTVLLFMLTSCINYVFLSDQIQSPGNQIVDGIHRASFIDVLFYTFSILTVLGFSTVTPITPAAKIAAVVQVLLSIGWLSLFTSILVKRVLR